MRDFGALWVLDSRVHLLEKAEVVEPPLALQHVLLAQGRARLHLHFPPSDSGAGVVQAIEKDLIDKKLFAFVNREGHTYERQIGGRRNRNIGDVDGGIGKAVIKILSQDRVAVIRQARFIKALPFGSVKFREVVPAEACNFPRCGPRQRASAGPP